MRAADGSPSPVFQKENVSYPISLMQMREPLEAFVPRTGFVVLFLGCSCCESLF